ncbi:hypothetical protein LX36DRAFT_313022 [Colletotrichum falcatum]|nr:hypothetical protein LX36DRAFT_313022 [Colletotrichum falcatum]
MGVQCESPEVCHRPFNARHHLPSEAPRYHQITLTQMPEDEPGDAPAKSHSPEKTVAHLELASVVSTSARTIRRRRGGVEVRKQPRARSGPFIPSPLGCCYLARAPPGRGAIASRAIVGCYRGPITRDGLLAKDGTTSTAMWSDSRTPLSE